MYKETRAELGDKETEFGLMLFELLDSSCPKPSYLTLPGRCANKFPLSFLSQFKFCLFVCLLGRSHL